jgi:hypothetical protein
MRIFSAVLCALSVILAAGNVQASTTIELPLNGTTTIVGPFPPEPTAATYGNPAYYAQVNIDIVYNGDLPSVQPIYEGQSDFEIFVSAGGGEEGFFAATDVRAYNQSGPGFCVDCQLAQSWSNTGLLRLTQDNFEITTNANFVNEYNYNAGDPLEDFFSIYATLPDGYSVAAVPEPSTWVMLLIGFAGIGLAKARRQYTLIPSAVMKPLIRFITAVACVGLSPPPINPAAI